MRILVPTADYPPIEGGISTVALQVSRELAALGHEVTVVAPFFPGQAAFDECEPVRVVRFGGYRLGWLRFFLMCAKTWPLVSRADLVLGINIAYGGLMGYWGQRFHGVPYVTFAYAYEFLKFRGNPFVASVLRAAYSHARVVVAISGFTRDNLVSFGVSPEKIATILPGAVVGKPWAEDALVAFKRKFTLDTPHVILAVGRFIPRKGHIALVQAMPRILEQFPDALLVLVGVGPCLYPSVQEAIRLNVREQVLFPGRLSDEEVQGLYQACEVFALPTGQDARGQVEGFGLVFSEAHAYGKPVVAGRSGGVVEAVIDGKTGVLVEPNQPEALADAILAILSDPAWGRQLGENGKRRVETELNWAAFTKQLLAAVEARA